jgi:beta propeller repeat protein
MKHAAVYGVMVLMSINVYSAVEVFPICTASGNQRYSSISGDIVVWQDDRNSPTGLDIYGCSLTLRQEFSISTAASSQEYPRISGDLVVWQDSRSFATKGYDIYGRRLSQGTDFPICTVTGNQQYPSVSGNIVVWYDTRNAATGNDIYGFDLASMTEFLICGDAGSQTRPAIDGDWVVWMDSRDGASQIYGCRLVFPIPAGGLTAIRLSPSSFAQGFPSVSGNKVVWHEKRDDARDFDVFGVNLDTRIEFLVCGHAGKQTNAAISGDLVVWQDDRNGSTRKDIYGCFLSGGGPFVLSATTADQMWPSVSGRAAVWEQGGDIWAARMPLPTVLTVLWPDGGEMFLAGSEQDIRWQTDGPAIAEVKIEFSADAGQGWQVVEPNIPDTGVYVWMTPIADSQVCLVRVSDIGTTGATDRSNAPFTVFRCDAALTADLTGDCRVNLADFGVFAAQWLACGNPYDPDWCWGR